MTGHYETTEQSGSAGLQRGSQQDDDLSTVLSSFTMGETKGQCWRVSESHWDKLKQIMYLTYCTFHTPNVSNKHRSRASMGGGGYSCTTLRNDDYMPRLSRRLSVRPHNKTAAVIIFSHSLKTFMG